MKWQSNSDGTLRSLITFRPDWDGNYVQNIQENKNNIRANETALNESAELQKFRK